VRNSFLTFFCWNSRKWQFCIKLYLIQPKEGQKWIFHVIAHIKMATNVLYFCECCTVWYFPNNHIKTTKIFSVQSSPDRPILKKIAVRSSLDPAEDFRSRDKDHTPEVDGVWNFWLRSRSCFGWIYSDTFSCFGIRLLFKLQSELSKFW